MRLAKLAAEQPTFLDFVRSLAPSARGAIAPPATLEGWQKRLDKVREGLHGSFGRLPETDASLDPEILGVIERDGYAIERLTFQTLPGVRATANLYRPEPGGARRAGVLCVHGHWAWARIDPNVQARCVGLVKRGYVVLAIDAFGAGERAIEPKSGTYHGALDGGSLWPTSTSLLGVQVYENRRAVDYLISRAEVDPTKLAITGASGGGNQAMYAGATDDRLKAVVPVCGVGRLEAYLGQGCCVCEVLAGGLRYATTGDILAMIAPRSLLVINATRDAIQFSVGEARVSVDYARERYRLLGVSDKIRQMPIEGEHGYSKPMREALYGWLDRELNSRGNGAPISEPELTLEDPRDLRCYPDGPSRPKTILTIPAFAIREGQARLNEAAPIADHKERWEADALRMKILLSEDVFGGFPKLGPLDLVLNTNGDSDEARLTSEPGIRLLGRRFRTTAAERRGSALLLRFAGSAGSDDSAVRILRENGRDVWTVDLRATGIGLGGSTPVHGVADHNPAEWALWVGRPLIGQWTWDALRWLDAVNMVDDPEGSGRGPIVVGQGAFSLVAFLAAGFHRKISACASLNGLVSLVGEKPLPWKGIPFGLLAPGILEAGDVGQLAALAAPRRLLIAGAVEPGGELASRERHKICFESTRTIYDNFRALNEFTVSPESDSLRALSAWLK